MENNSPENSADFPPEDTKPASKTSIRSSDRTLLAELEKISKVCLSKVLKRCLDSADDALFEQSEKAENSTTQSEFFATMRDIRVKREEMLASFNSGITKSFQESPSTKKVEVEKDKPEKLELSLMEDSDLELSVAVDSITGKCERQFANLLPSLNARFATLRGHNRSGQKSTEDLESLEDPSANPITPEKICDIFSQTLEVLDTELSIQIVIYKLFERALLEDIDKLYEAINAKLLKNRILVDYVPSHVSQEERKQIVAQEEAAANLADQLADQAMSDGTVANKAISVDNPASHSAAAFASFANQTGMSPVGQFFGGNLTAGSLPGLEISANEIQLANEMAQLLSYLPRLGQLAGSTENAQLIGQAVEGMNASATPTIGYDALLHLLHKLQQQQAPLSEAPSVDSADSVEEELTTPHEVLQNLSNELDAASEDDDGSIGYSERDTIGLVSMLFQFIIDDRIVSKVMRRTLGRLQLPIIKVALKDPRFFTNSSHPARVFLNNITSASVSWAESDSYENDPFYKKIVEFVDYIVDEFNDDLIIFDQLTQQLGEFVEKDKKRVEKTNQRLLDVEQGKDKTYAAKRDVKRLLVQKLEVSTPEFIAKMLSAHYSDYLISLALQDGKESSNYQSALVLIDNLVWTVSELRSKEDYKAILTKIPEVVKGLQKSFDAMFVERSKSVPFFKKLATLHKSVMQREEPLATDVAPHQTAFPETTPQVQLAESTPEAEVKPIDLESSVQDVTQEAEAETESSGANEELDNSPVELVPSEHQQVEDTEDAAYIEKAENLAVGQWVEVVEDEDKLRCRLAAILRASGKRVFVNRRGVKALDMYLEELVDRIKEETLILLDDNQLFDKALSSVIGDLREQRRETLAC